MSRQAEGYLLAIDPLLLQPQYTVFSEGASIGRNADTCAIILSSDYVSREHCVLEPQNGDVVLTDKGSTNGTYVNGQRVTRHVLQDEDTIACGRPSHPNFIFTRTPRPEERHYRPPRQASYRIGRLAENDLPLVNDPTVSARHARLEIRRDGLRLTDLGSANGVFVNGIQVTSSLIGPEDVVGIGSTELFFRLEHDKLCVTAREKRNQVRLEALELLRRHKQKRLLQNVDLVVEPGDFVGVLGPSGAGKSTLLNALNGFVPADSGMVLLNGTSLYHTYDMFRNTIGYVPQDDIIHRELTVERSLLYTAQLRLPKDYTRKGLEQQVTSVIETLGLNHVRGNFVTQLSGGQRKRVSIGCELLTRPSVVFLDEPTSGLDPSTEEKLMNHFGRMAEQGQTVVLTTHILYNLDLLDKVILLSRGRLVYYGPVAEVCPFFSEPGRTVERPIEVFDLLEPETATTEEREERAAFYEQKYRYSPLFETHVQNKLRGPSEAPAEIVSRGQGIFAKGRRFISELFNARQFGILVRRAFDLKLSFPSRLAAPMLIPLLLAVLTGTIEVDQPGAGEEARQEFENENALFLQRLDQSDVMSGEEFAEMRFEGIANLPIPLSLPLLMVMTAVFLGTLTACLEISAERSVYLRERAVNLSIPVYVASKLPALFMLTLVQCFLYVAIVVSLLDIDHVNPLALILILTGVAWGSVCIGLLISSLDPTAGQNSVILAIVVVLPQLLFSGAMGPGFYGGMHVATKAIASVFPARWGFELMLTALYPEPAWVEETITGEANGGGMGFEFGSFVYARNAVALAAIAVGCCLATCFSLRRYDKL